MEALSLEVSVGAELELQGGDENGVIVTVVKGENTGAGVTSCAFPLCAGA